MKKMSKLTTLLIIAVMATMILAGCSSEEEPTETVKETVKEVTADDNKEEAEEAVEDAVEEVSQWEPDGDITIRVPSGAGGAFDTYMRLFAQGLKDELDTNVIVTNLPGANGSIAASDLMGYDPSPYEIMGGNVGMFTSAPLFQPDIALDIEDFELIGSLKSADVVLYASSQQSEIATWEDLIEYSKGNEVVLGTQPPGNAVQALATALLNEAGIEFTNVVSDSANKDIIQVVSGDITLSLGAPVVGMQYFQEGTIVPILCFAEDPNTEFEGVEVPTAKSKGIDLIFRSNNFVMARKGTDPLVLNQMYDAFIAYQTTDEFKELAESISYVPYSQKGEDLKAEVLSAASMFKDIFEKYYQ